MKHIILLFFHVIFIISFSYSENNDSIQQHIADSIVLESIQKADSSINQVIIPLVLPKDSLLIYKEKSVELQDSIFIKENEVNLLNDSIKALNLTIIEKNILVSEYKELITKSDTIALKLINSRLQIKFNHETNSEAIKILQSISSNSIKGGDLYKRLHSLTIRYGKDYKEILLILQEAQKDINRENMFSSDYSKYYKTKLMNSYYYRDVYINSWTIPFMDWLIDEALNRLVNHDLDKEAYADFTDLIL